MASETEIGNNLSQISYANVFKSRFANYTQCNVNTTHHHASRAEPLNKRATMCGQLEQIPPAIIQNGNLELIRKQNMWTTVLEMLAHPDPEDLPVADVEAKLV